MHAAFCSKDVTDEPEFKDVRETMRNRWFWVFNRNLWTGKGVYVSQDLEAIGRSQTLNTADLEKSLNGGKEINGIRFSKDKLVRFAPKESYKFGEHTPKSFAKDGFIIASCGVEGAEKLGEASTKFKFKKPYILGVETQAQEQRVSAFCEDDDGLDFGGGSFDYGDGGRAFGVY